jgi:hypothetical protein
VPTGAANDDSDGLRLLAPSGPSATRAIEWKDFIPRDRGARRALDLRVADRGARPGSRDRGNDRHPVRIAKHDYRTKGPYPRVRHHRNPPPAAHSAHDALTAGVYGLGTIRAVRQSPAKHGSLAIKNQAFGPQTLEAHARSLDEGIAEIEVSASV